MKINFNNNSKKLYLEFKTPEGKHEVIIEKKIKLVQNMQKLLFCIMV